MEFNLWWLVPPGLGPALDAVRAAGVPVVIVSNSEGLLDVLFEHRLHIAQHFDLVVDSGKVGIEKPDPRIWQVALEAYPTPPAGVLHLGDTYTTDIAGPEPLGFRAALIDPFSHYAERHLATTRASPASSRSPRRSSEVRPARGPPRVDRTGRGAPIPHACGSQRAVCARGRSEAWGARSRSRALLPGDAARPRAFRSLARPRCRRASQTRAEARRFDADAADPRCVHHSVGTQAPAPAGLRFALATSAVARSVYDAGLVLEMTNDSPDPLPLEVDDSCGTFEAQASNGTANSFESDCFGACAGSPDPHVLRVTLEPGGVVRKKVKFYAVQTRVVFDEKDECVTRTTGGLPPGAYDLRVTLPWTDPLPDDPTVTRPRVLAAALTITP